LIEEGRSLSATDYIAARAHQQWLRAALPLQVADDLDALLLPATLGPAPDPSTTGDPRFNSPWSYTGSPVVSFPIGLSSDGLPLALQLVEPRPLREFELIATARWCEDVVRSACRPESE
jgi:aspartyl-tRNA(Asn)/glutamyl-tRNA(Gln) amidotransferase subunit A